MNIFHQVRENLISIIILVHTNNMNRVALFLFSKTKFKPFNSIIY